MTARLCLCLGIAALLASCDKSKDSDKSTSAGGSKSVVGSTRGSRPTRTSVPTTRQGMRESLNEAMKVQDVESRDYALAEVARNALTLAPDISAEAIKQLSSNSKERAALLQFCAKFLVARDPDEALTWAASFGSEKDRAAAKAAVALVLMGSDTARAVKLISPSDIANSEAGGAAVQVLQQWTVSAPTDAVAWVLKCPPGDARKAGMTIVANQWVAADSQSAFSWLGTLTNQGVRKEASRALAEALISQPEPIRGAMLEPVDPAIRSELGQQIDEITHKERGEMEAVNPTPEPPAPEPPAPEPPPVVVAPEVPVTDVPAPEAPMQEEPAGDEPAEDEPEEPESSE